MTGLNGLTFHRDKVQTLLRPADRAVVVVDSSGSRVSNAWDAIGRDAVSITEGLERRGTQVGVLSFSDEAYSEKEIEVGGKASDSVKCAFDHPLRMSSMGMHDAIGCAATMLGGPGLVLVFTDGMGDPRDDMKNTVSYFESQGVQVVGIGRDGDHTSDLAGVFNEFYLTTG